MGVRQGPNRTLKDPRKGRELNTGHVGRSEGAPRDPSLGAHLACGDQRRNELRREQGLRLDQRQIEPRPPCPQDPKTGRQE